MPHTTKDPVCAMEVDRTKGIKQKHQGQNFYFCSDACRRKFKADPDSYTTAHA